MKRGRGLVRHSHADMWYNMRRRKETKYASSDGSNRQDDDVGEV